MPDSSAAANDAMVRAFLAAWERRDTGHIVDRFSDDAVYHSMPLAPIVGKAAIRAFVTLNGQPVVLPICGTFEIEDGRITAWREYFDLGPARAAYGAP